MFLAVVFDFDGTLVDSSAIKREGFFQVTSAYAGSAMHMEAVLAGVTGDRRTIFEAFAKQAPVQPGKSTRGVVDELVANYSSTVDAAVVSAPEVLGATRLLETLRHRKIKLYLNSATPLKNLEKIVTRRGWTRHFEGVFGAPASKVDTLRHVMAVTGLSSRAIAVVGDGKDDELSAKSVGCAFFPVGEARGKDETLEKIYTLPELIPALLDTP